MSSVIAIAGKGGTGKTTAAALFIRYLISRNRRPVLAVDADADSNLPEAIGMPQHNTIGKAREEFFQQKGQVPAGMPKEAFLELKLNQVITEGKDIDLLVMGRPEGPGCYCYINNVLRQYLETLGKNYPFVIIDNEAGLEHLSRRIAQDINALVVVSDYSLNGLRAAARIKELSEEVHLNAGKICLVINGVPETVSERFMDEVRATGLTLLGSIPHSDIVPQYDIEKKSLLDLPDTCPVVTASEDIAGRLFEDALSARKAQGG